MSYDDLISVRNISAPFKTTISSVRSLLRFWLISFLALYKLVWRFSNSILSCFSEQRFLHFFFTVKFEGNPVLFIHQFLNNSSSESLSIFGLILFNSSSTSPLSRSCIISFVIYYCSEVLWDRIYSILSLESNLFSRFYLEKFSFL